MKLSPHFDLIEFTRSQVASRMGFSNEPGTHELANLKLLCEFLLEPVRDEFGPIRITSGYRCSMLNQAIGSKSSSQHKQGKVADFEAVSSDITNFELAWWIVQNCDFDQLILEYHNTKEPKSGWVHASYNGEGNRGIVGRINKYGYREGLTSNESSGDSGDTEE